MKNCPSCHYSNKDEARFCAKCGTPLPNSNFSANPNPNPADRPNPASSDGLQTGQRPNPQNPSSNRGFSPHYGPNSAGPNGYAEPPRQPGPQNYAPVPPAPVSGPSAPQPKKSGSAGKIVLIVLAAALLLGVGAFGGWFFFT